MSRPGAWWWVVLAVSCGAEPVRPPDSGTDAGLDAGGNGGVDAGFDAGVDAGQDAGVDAGRDAGSLPFASVSDAGVISAPAERWAWVPVPDSTCGNGSSSGMAVNLKPGARELVVYLEGGGACWDAFTCFALGSAVNITTGYGAASFERDLPLLAPRWPRDGGTFGDGNFVYIPYCTGDVFFGDKVSTYGAQSVHHRGKANVEAFLRLLGPTFGDAQRVYVTGSSAGGYGAQLNYPAFSATFPSAEVHVLADCAPLVQPTGTLYQTWIDSWGMVPPAGCAACATSFPEYVTFLINAAGSRRVGLLAYESDSTIRAFFGFLFNPQDFTTATRSLLTSRYDGKTNARYFVLPGEGHVMLGNVGNLTGAGGVRLSTWLGGFLDGGSDWVNVKP